jgi:hypothetical protein
MEEYLLDYWGINQKDTISADRAPIAFFTTSYSFDSQFFEEECLSRFLGLQGESEADGLRYVIEKEEKLATLAAAVVIVDQANAKGPKNIRWQLLSCRVKNGIQHSKISILQWSGLTRLIISSANITRQGYCMNQEVYAVFDFFNNCEEDKKIFEETIVFLEHLVQDCFTSDVQRNTIKKLKDIKTRFDEYEIPNKRFEIKTKPLFVSPNNSNAIYENFLSQAKKHWGTSKEYYPNRIIITSPFFDQEETQQDSPTKLLLKSFSNDKCSLTYNVTIDKSEPNNWYINAPQRIQSDAANNVFFKEIKAEEEISKVMVSRPLHAKTFWFENTKAKQILYIIGSSNFTSPGLGLHARKNYEANISYLVDATKSGKKLKELENSLIKSNPINEAFKFKYLQNSDEPELENNLVILDSFFEDAIWLDNGKLELKFNTKLKVPFEFEIFLDKSEIGDQTNCGELIYSASKFIQENKKAVVVNYSGNIIPQYLFVSWQDKLGDKKYSLWNVFVLSHEKIPIHPKLKELKFSDLISVLKSTQPLYRLLSLLANAEKNLSTIERSTEKPINPHDHVDTANFILKRTREQIISIQNVVAILCKPVYSQEALMYRFFQSPISPIKYADALERHLADADDDERNFLMSELILEIKNAKLEFKEFGLSVKIFEKQKSILIQELKQKIKNTNSPIGKYVKSTLKDI